MLALPLLQAGKLHPPCLTHAWPRQRPPGPPNHWPDPFCMWTI